MVLLFEFEHEPVAKGRPRVTRTGHAFTPAKTRKAEDAFKRMATERMEGDPLTGPIEVEIHLFFKRPKSNKSNAHVQRPDLDNAAKLILDSCNGIVWVDDSQITDLIVHKRWIDKEPYCEMRVATLNFG